MAEPGVRLVDTVEVAQDGVEDYLELLRSVAVPVMTGAGATLVSCATTPDGMGEDVAVQVVWGFEDYERWNEIRRNLVLDPRWYRFGTAAARLRRGGTRRFFADAPVLGGRQDPPRPPAARGGPVLRRIETYAIRPGAPHGAVGTLQRALAACGAHVPEVLASAVGRNESDAPVHLVWEHAFASPEAYRRYMVHPYHATVLDRYLLQDSPECVVAPDSFGAGLVGYRCDDASFGLEAGVRRLVLLRVDDAASRRDVERLWGRLRQVPASVPTMAVSVVGANTLGPAWFDGEHPVSGPPRWTHLWEQGFGSRPAFEDYRASGGPAAVVADGPGGWGEWSGGVVAEVAELLYALGGRDPLGS